MQYGRVATRPEGHLLSYNRTGGVFVPPVVAFTDLQWGYTTYVVPMPKDSTQELGTSVFVNRRGRPVSSGCRIRRAQSRIL